MHFSPAPVDTAIADRLKAFPFFSKLQASNREDLCRQVQALHLEKGQKLLVEGSACEAFLLVERGGIRVFKDTPGGKGITLYLVHPGESCLLGVSCLLGHTAYPARAEVEGVTDALAIPAPLFRRLFQSEEPLQQFVMGLVSHRMSNLIWLVEDVAFRKMDERLAAFLLDQASKTPGALAPITMSHEQIASHLGTAREVVSRLLLQFSKDSLLIPERRNIRILDPDGLKKRAGQT